MGMPPSSVPPPKGPEVYLYTNDIALWLQVLLGITACVAALLLLTCLLLCCMRLCGCWTGNILGVGALRRPMEDTDHMGCWCCRPPMISNRTRIDDDGSYVIQMRKDASVRSSQPSTPKNTWMPHTKPFRDNKQSTH